MSSARCARVALLLFTLTLSLPSWAQRPTNAFALKILNALEFVDYPDALVMVTDNQSEIWTRYDDVELGILHKKRPLFERWVDATTSPLGGDLTSKLLAIHRIFDESTTDFRELPIDDA